MKNKTLVGRTEIVSFPELGIDVIPAKIDTGAYSTALHASKIWIEIEDEKEVLHFELPRLKGEPMRCCKSKSFYQKKVRSSNGRLEKRYIIKTKMILGGIERITHVGLTNRDKMRFPVLVGRRILRQGFLVDVSKSNIYHSKSTNSSKKQA